MWLKKQEKFNKLKCKREENEKKKEIYQSICLVSSYIKMKTYIKIFKKNSKNNLL
jgi:hypothetical protein